ncbi:hypothetical protein AB0I49_03475 [Streptomyces sp. NPDC050617]|uniref:hypothetical protein n=1 Tax=Streptomyces sp. NPDC050617 TaxID=3154628 RepID=UPI0034486547
MSERWDVRNELSGNVEGPVVQAGSVHGDVVFNSSSTSADQAAYEAEARSRTRAEWAAEDAARAYSAAQEDKERRSTRRYRWFYSLVLFVSLVGGVLWARDDGGFWSAAVPFCLAGIGLSNSYMKRP